MSSVVRKEDAHRLVDQLPANATWEDWYSGTDHGLFNSWVFGDRLRFIQFQPVNGGRDLSINLLISN